jgi:hypothetical protein
MAAGALQRRKIQKALVIATDRWMFGDLPKVFDRREGFDHFFHTHRFDEAGVDAVVIGALDVAWCSRLIESSKAKAPLKSPPEPVLLSDK